MRLSGRPRTTLSLFAAAAIALAACEGAPTGAAPSARETKPALTLHPCSPSISGPSSLAVNAQGTYTLNYWTNSGCTNPTVSWSVNNGAQVVWTSSAWSSLSGGQAIAGQAGIKAGSCDFDIEAGSSYNGGLGTTSYKKVLVRDCTPLSIALSAGSGLPGGIKLTWNAVRADSFRVYRKVVARGSGSNPAFSYRGTSTGTTFNDTGYRLSNQTDYEFSIWYRVDSYDSYGLLTTQTVFTYAEDFADDA